MKRLPEILLVCEDQNLMAGFFGLVAGSHPDIKIHCINPNEPEAWDAAVRATMDKPRIAFIGLKTSTVDTALALRSRPHSEELPWMVLLHPEVTKEDLGGYYIPYARVRLHWDTHERHRELDILFEFLSICQYS